MRKGIIIVFILFSIIIAADTFTPLGIEGRPLMMAEHDALLHAKKGIWFSAGLIFNLFAVGISYLFVPAPPPEALLGKSEQFISIYTENYRKAVQAINTRWTIFGCVGNTALVSSVFLVYAVKEGCQEACSNTTEATVEKACSSAFVF